MTLLFVFQSLGSARSGQAATHRLSLGTYVAGLLLAVAAGGGYGAMLAVNAANLRGPAVPTGDIPLYTSANHVYGDPKAKITIVAFTDLYCPSCRNEHNWLKARLDTDLKGRARLITRHWPVINQHPLAVTAAMLAEWAAEQGKYYEFIHAVAGIQDNENVQALLQAVQRVPPLNVMEAMKYMNEPAQADKYLQAVHDDWDAGNKLGVGSTPTWYIEYPDKRIETAVGQGIEPKVDGKLFQSYLTNER
jgi:protein-disulfide isomerase